MGYALYYVKFAGWLEGLSYLILWYICWPFSIGNLGHPHRESMVRTWISPVGEWEVPTEPRGSWADSLVFGKGWLLKHKNAMIQNAVPLALMWCFWSK